MGKKRGSEYAHALTSACCCHTQVGKLPEALYCKREELEPTVVELRPGLVHSNPLPYPPKYLAFRNECTVPADTELIPRLEGMDGNIVFFKLHLTDPRVVEERGCRGGLSDGQLARLWHPLDDDPVFCFGVSEFYRRWALADKYPWIIRDLKTIYGGDVPSWFPVYHLVASETEMEQIGDRIALHDFGVVNLHGAGLYDELKRDGDAPGDAPDLTCLPISGPEELYVRQHLMFLLR